LEVATIGKTSHVTDNRIQEGYINHAVMAQAHRWYQIYENPEARIENTLDTLAPDIKLKSGLGEATGHDAYRQRIGQLPKTWRNAHNVTGSNMAISSGGGIHLNLNVTYLNRGMRSDGSVRTAELVYVTELKQTGTVLPQFTNIEIKQLNEGTVSEFEDAYSQNRLLSLVHYWLAIIEDPRRNPEPAREILTDGFLLNFSSGAISHFEGFRAWFGGPGSQVTASTHKLSNFSQKPTRPNTYELSVDFDWRGILPDKKEIVAKTRHRWSIIDNPKERFARIKSVDVEVLEPYRPNS
jgi:hypothetical protein